MKEFEIIRSDRRSVGIEVTRDARVKVRVPRKMTDEQIAEVIKKYSEWIDKKLAEANSRRNIFSDSNESDTRALISAAKKYIPERVKYWAKITGLSPSGVKITRAKTRYGSCSPTNSLCFSCYCMRLEMHEIDYVVVHELAHVKEKNHGKNFYKIIEKYLPDYKKTIYDLRHK